MTRKGKNARPKLEIVFNSGERQEFLTGFSKRKQARKKAARDQIEQRYREEVTRIKKEKRDRIKHRLEEVASVKNSEGVDLAELARNELDKEKVLDLPQHVVTITSTEEIDLTDNKPNSFLGSNNTGPVEVIDAADDENEDDEDKETEESVKAVKKPSDKKAARLIKKSKVKAADLARRVQSLKSNRRRPSQKAPGKISKAQKKFMKKRRSKKQIKAKANMNGDT